MTTSPGGSVAASTIAAGLAEQLVLAGTTDDRITAVTAEHDVVYAQAVDRIAAPETADHVRRWVPTTRHPSRCR